MMRHAGLACCLAAALAAGAAGPAGAQSRAAVAPVVVRPAAEQTMQATLVGFGTVQSNSQSLVAINVPHSGFVHELRVRAGQAVSKGAPLFDLAPTPAASLAFQQAQQALAFAQGDLARVQRLYSEQLATHDQLAKARTALTDAEAVLRAQQQAGAGHASQVIKAPFAGTVTTVAATEGQQLQQGAQAMTLARGDALVVRLGIEPASIGKVQTGMPVRLAKTFDATIKYKAHVSAVDAVVDPKTRLVDVLVALEQPSGNPALIGTMMRGEIILGSRSALAVPRNAVLRDLQGAYVYVIRQDKAHRVAVTTGLENEKRVAVTGKLEPGDPVVVEGNYELADGMRVRIDR